MFLQKNLKSEQWEVENCAVYKQRKFDFEAF